MHNVEDLMDELILDILAIVPLEYHSEETEAILWGIFTKPVPPAPFLEDQKGDA
jgi:hypothetical protein